MKREEEKVPKRAVMRIINRIFGVPIVVFLITVPAFTSLGAENKEGTAEQSPLIGEMKILDAAFREIVSAVAVGDAGRVVKAVDSMHGTMEKTDEGLRSGSVKIPRNASRAKEFTRLDRNFHHELQRLRISASADRKKEMLSSTKKLLDGCVTCHGIFR